MPSETSRFFRAQVRAVNDVTSSFRRFTFGGDDLADYGDPGFDQRVKVVFPSPGAPLDLMPTGPDWYAHWRQMPQDGRPAFRTYTTRAVRREPCEVDLDMVVHGDGGPAAAWINTAQVGDEVLIYAPTTARSGVSLGVDFVPPARTDAIVLAGDETAAPAIAAILEQLPHSARGVVVLEVPEAGDLDYLPQHPGFQHHLGARDGGAHGNYLEETLPGVVAQLTTVAPGTEVEEIDIDTELLWEVPRAARGGAALASAPIYAWLAGEAGAITRLRRHLVTERGFDRRAVAFMGYWRLGRAEN